MTYSLEMAPATTSAAASNSHNHVKKLSSAANGDEHPNLEEKHPYLYDNNEVSTLSIGGVNPSYYTGEINWYDTSACIGCWNLTTDIVGMSGQFYHGDKVNLQF